MNFFAFPPVSSKADIPVSDGAKADFSLPSSKGINDVAAPAVLATCFLPPREENPTRAGMIVEPEYRETYLNAVRSANRRDGLEGDTLPTELVLSHQRLTAMRTEVEPVDELSAFLGGLAGDLVRAEGATVAIVMPDEDFYSPEAFQRAADANGMTILAAIHDERGATIYRPNADPEVDPSAVVDDGDVHTRCPQRPSIRFGN
ncbi:MAG: hypothetical protein ACXIVD_16430 [Salinarimonas sp.]